MTQTHSAEYISLVKKNLSNYTQSDRIEKLLYICLTLLYELRHPPRPQVHPDWPDHRNPDWPGY